MILIQDVTITQLDGKQYVFTHSKQPTLKVIAPGMPVMLEFESALGTPQGLVVLAPGMVVQYGDAQVTTSQVADNGLVPVKTEVEPLD